ncbi:hypothetical protein RhiJN_16990 [Ceratobasidium sp. AG-Ba]|nr:hypothetical protein RhiJN_16990 [Ceratobasidium sp. AG-Ba]
MVHLTRRFGSAALLLFLSPRAAFGRLINTTIFDTNPAHITYEPREDFCVRWMSHWWSGKSCEMWAQPWTSEVYYDHGRFTGVHRSLNHQLVSMNIEFEGSAIWLYGPPRAQVTVIPPDYKICIQQAHPMVLDEACYRIDIARAYLTAERYDEPVVIFAKGGLQYQSHRVVVSVADPIGSTRTHLGIRFSHAIYTIERPAPWPIDEDKWRFRQVVMHNTHPLLSYHPTPQSSDCSLLGCSPQMGWAPRTYRAEDGNVVSWHELKSRNEQNIEQWGVETSIVAGSVGVYGIPKAHITSTDYLSHICIAIDFGRCEAVDVQRAYLNTKHEHESVLLWRHDALDSSRTTRIAVRLLKTTANEMNVFPFKAIEYYEPQEYSSPGLPVGRLENIEVAHDNEQIVYHPGRRCVRHFGRRCTKWWDPWVWREEGPWETRLTYRSTVWSHRTTEDPSIELDFRGSAVYVYGAPKAFIKAPFASQHICINDVCRIIDVEQAYLNAPVNADLRSLAKHESESRGPDINERTDNAITSGFRPEYEPVLIWSMAGLDDQVSHRLRLALAGLPSKDDAEMSIAKIVYTKVVYEPGESRPDPPVPQPDPRYEGPMYPPYARQWAPRHPLPPSSLPSPSPPSPPSSPHQPSRNPPSRHTPPRANPPNEGNPMTSLILSIMFFLLLSLVICTACGCLFGYRIAITSSAPERRRLRQSKQNYYG